jgi:DNA-binding transcriptional ArsR family regulator
MLHFVLMRNRETAKSLSTLQTTKALASPVRMEIMRMLREPVANFPPQVDGDLVKDGVCADLIRERLGIAAATASRHLTLLTDSGLLVATRKKGWTFYRRDERAIRQFVRQLHVDL